MNFQFIFKFTITSFLKRTVNLKIKHMSNIKSAKDKMLCPHKEKCQRSNPTHLNEMAHPHLEKLIIHQLDKTISLPENLNFKCDDRSKLLEQLKVLQIIMKKNQPENSSSQCSVSSEASDTECIIIDEEDKTQKSIEQLKEKINRHKQATLKKREARLNTMDTNEKVAIKKPRSSINTESSPSSSKTELLKKGKKINDEGQESRTSSSSSSKSSSIMDKFVESTDRLKREKLRDSTIARMKQAGHKITLAPPGEFALKYALSAPYHYFLNRVEKEKVTYDQQFTVSFPELLDISLGEITNSLQINFMVEVGWLCLQYLLAAQNPKMTIVCGEICDPQSTLPSNINLIKVRMPTAFGCHHSKVSVIQYKDDGIRIIVSTANIYSDDWENRTQGIWMSPHLPRLPDTANSTDGDSPTKFKKDFRAYLAAYSNPELVEWENIIKRADFSSVNVFFVASVPGSHKNWNLNSWGHRRLGTILSEHAVLPKNAEKWTLIAQSSSIGNLGPDFNSWVSSNIVVSMSREQFRGVRNNPEFKFVYPSLKNYETSYDCKAGSCCLPYSRQSNEKQGWLKNYLYQWKADETSRTKAMPHIKSYTRISPDYTQIPWFVLTSANLSKGAWGSTAKTGASHYVMNYEAGVVFLPKFVINKTTFPIKESDSPDIPVFRIPYDLPLTKYESSDVPFVVDYLSD